MTTLNRGWGRRVWLSGTVACVVSLGSVVARAGIIGGDNLMVRANGIIGGDLEVLGVVEKVEPATSTVTVLGQTVRLTAQTRTSGTALTKGALVAVYGKFDADGTISASEVSVQAGQYVAGATSLYVRGVVKSVNASLATATVGGLSIDFSSSLAGGSSITAGSVAEFSGLQTSSSTLYASRSARVTTDGIIGGDVTAKTNGIIGGDVTAKTNGIIGGDVTAKTNGIIGGDVTAKTNGIIGGDVTAKTNGIIGGDLKVQVVSNGIIGGDRVTANGIIGGDRL